MMRDILLEISQRGTEKLDPQSVPLDQRPLASNAPPSAAPPGCSRALSGKYCSTRPASCSMLAATRSKFLYGDYNYENIDDTDCLPAVAQYLVQHLLGYYNITRTFYSVSKHNGRSIAEKTRQVFIKRHHEDTPFDPSPPGNKIILKLTAPHASNAWGAVLLYAFPHCLVPLRAGPRPPYALFPIASTATVISSRFSPARQAAASATVRRPVWGVAQLSAEL